MNCLTARGSLLFVVVLFSLSFVTNLSAQTYTVLHSFAGSDGASPQPQLTQGLNGDLFGTAVYGGLANYGVVYGFSTDGSLTSLYSFNNSDGANPFGTVTVGPNGDLYGTTNYGGPGGLGTFYTIPGHQIVPLHAFQNYDGYPDQSGVILGADGNFYGTTLGGGNDGYGTVFQITAGGALTKVHSFTGTDGAGMYDNLAQGNDGYFYGTTFTGGKADEGTIFKVNTTGSFITLHNFCLTGIPCSDGGNSTAGLTPGSDGNFYGATSKGGSSTCYFDGYEGCGVLYKITSTGTFTVLHVFDGTDGAQPLSAPIQGTDGNFYGVTLGDGANSYGTIYMMTPSGALTTLYSFCALPTCADGSTPVGSVMQDTNGLFYGVTTGGGSANDGTLYSLDVGLGPFVKTIPTISAPGRAVRILGTNLTGSTSVTFNGTPATFTVVSASQITATVPVGATTGPVQVVTPGGTLTSNANFTVR